MKYGSFKGKHKEQTSSSNLIIVVVVFTTALSFTLGYFVGKAGNEKQPQSQIIAIQQQEPAVAVQEQSIQGNEQTASDSQTQAVEGKPAQDKELHVQTVTVVKENNYPLPSPKSIQNSEPEKKTQKAVLYTVQIGAFKNPKDAEALKHKLENKGYKAYIIKKSLPAKNVRLFKVRAGEFINRQEADALALKLKTAEGLKAFVTFKDEGSLENESLSFPDAAKQEKPR